MALIRMLVSWKATADPSEDAFTNTLYFNASGGVGQPPDYQSLCNDLADIYRGTPWVGGRDITVKAYNMEDAVPRPIKAQATRSPVDVSAPNGPPQVALCLSYYVDRNLPRFRGRIYLGPWASPASRPTSAIQARLITFGQALAGLGGLNVDWSLYSETRQQSERLSNIWVDNSWDIIRSRKVKATNRVSASING